MRRSYRVDERSVARAGPRSRTTCVQDECSMRALVGCLGPCTQCRDSVYFLRREVCRKSQSQTRATTCLQHLTKMCGFVRMHNSAHSTSSQYRVQNIMSLVCARVWSPLLVRALARSSLRGVAHTHSQKYVTTLHVNEVCVHAGHIHLLDIARPYMDCAHIVRGSFMVSDHGSSAQYHS